MLHAVSTWPRHLEPWVCLGGLSPHQSLPWKGWGSRLLWPHLPVCQVDTRGHGRISSSALPYLPEGPRLNERIQPPYSREKQAVGWSVCGERGRRKAVGG